MTERFRVATYNVHGCVGRGGARAGLMPERVAEVIEQLGCEIVALQEIDVGRPRSGAVDQLTAIARHLGYRAVFGPAWESHERGAYGNALLTKWHIAESATHALPEHAGLRCEPRSLMQTRVQAPFGDVLVWNTHLGVRAHERASQAAALLERVKEALVTEAAPLVVVGDFNAGPSSTVVRRLATVLVEPRQKLAIRAKTFPAWWPVFALDHVLVGPPLTVEDIFVARSPLAALASDHLPLAATLRLEHRSV